MRATVPCIAAFFLAACSAPPEKQQSAQRPPASPVSNTIADGNAGSDSYSPANSAGASMVEQSSSDGRRRRIRPRHTPIPGAVAPSLEFREAAEDSTAAASMDGTGNIIEYRVFRSHPKLSRVEARWSGRGEIIFKIELRGGEVVVRQTRKIKNLQTATTRELVALAGN